MQHPPLFPIPGKGYMSDVAFDIRVHVWDADKSKFKTQLWIRSTITYLFDQTEQKKGRLLILHGAGEQEKIAQSKVHSKWTKWKQKNQKNNNRDSNVVPHRSTNLARQCLTSLSRREAVLSLWYGRSWHDWSIQTIWSVCSDFTFTSFSHLVQLMHLRLAGAIRLSYIGSRKLIQLNYDNTQCDKINGSLQHLGKSNQLRKLR